MRRWYVPSEGGNVADRPVTVGNGARSARMKGKGNGFLERKDTRMKTGSVLQWCVLAMMPSFTAMLAGCTHNPTFPEHDTEFDYTWEVLQAFCIYQERLPGNPYVYNTPIDLCKSINDPYTYYLSPEQASEFWKFLTTATGGTGVMVDTADGRWFLKRVFPDAPGSRAGLEPGDTLLAINGTSITGLAEDEINSILGFPIGDTVAFSIKRLGKELSMTVVITEYLAPSVFTDTLDSSTAYLMLTGFFDSTGTHGGSQAEFNTALDETAWARYTVLDLRHNPGGELEQCRSIVSQFVPENTAIIKSQVRVYDTITGKSWTTDSTIVAIKGQKALTRRFAVLVDEFTASASEILVNCLKERRAADVRIIGTTTYGKGTSWMPVSTPRGGIVSVTAQLLIPVTNPVYNLAGIEPDISIDTTGGDAQKTALALIETGGLGKRLQNSSQAAHILALYTHVPRNPWLPMAFRRR